MRGHHVPQTWTYKPHLYAPPRYRKACAYDAFVPDPLANLYVRLPGDLAATLSDAETAISRLNAEQTAIMPQFISA